LIFSTPGAQVHVSDTFSEAVANRHLADALRPSLRRKLRNATRELLTK
jgi:hypothetical protein